MLPLISRSVEHGDILLLDVLRLGVCGWHQVNPSRRINRRCGQGAHNLRLELTNCRHEVVHLGTAIGLTLKVIIHQ